MKEKANLFFTLLNESYRLNAEERIEDITVVSVPNMERSDAENVISSYKEAARDIMELTKEDNNFDDLSKLKELFGQK